MKKIIVFLIILQSSLYAVQPFDQLILQLQDVKHQLNLIVWQEREYAKQINLFGVILNKKEVEQMLKKKNMLQNKYEVIKKNLQKLSDSSAQYMIECKCFLKKASKL